MKKLIASNIGDNPAVESRLLTAFLDHIFTISGHEFYTVIKGEDDFTFVEIGNTTSAEEIFDEIVSELSIKDGVELYADTDSISIVSHYNAYTETVVIRESLIFEINTDTEGDHRISEEELYEIYKTAKEKNQISDKSFIDYVLGCMSSGILSQF